MRGFVIPGTSRDVPLYSGAICSTSVHVLGLIVLAISIAPIPLHCCLPHDLFNGHHCCIHNRRPLTTRGLSSPSS